jgi:hypothetical protein
LALTAERDKGLLPRLGFRAGGEHSGRCVGCAGAGCLAIKDLDQSATRRQAPRDAEPHDPRAYNDELWFAEAPKAIFQEMAPFAGMTQTGSTGVISAATGAAPLAVSIKDGDFRAFLQASRNEESVKWRLREAVPG